MSLQSYKQHFSNDYTLALSSLPHAYYGSHCYPDCKIIVMFQASKD